MHATTIVAYAYQADMHCPECIRKAFASGHAPPGGGTAEETLDRAARHMGITRHDADTNAFPVPAHANESNEEGYEHCGTCGDCLGHDLSDCRPNGHPIGQCPGLGACEHAWHLHGCEPFWDYGDADGTDISGSPTAELDATEKRLWEGPDEPSEVWVRDTPDGEWRRDN